MARILASRHFTVSEKTTPGTWHKPIRYRTYNGRGFTMAADLQWCWHSKNDY